MSDTQPPEGSPTPDVPATIKPDAPTEVQSADEASAATVVDRPSPVTAPPEPPPAIAAAMDAQTPVAPPPAPEPGDSVSTPPPPVPEPPAWTPEPESDSGPAALIKDRPEVAVGAAFAGGLVLALILKRLAR